MSLVMFRVKRLIHCKIEMIASLIMVALAINVKFVKSTETPRLRGIVQNEGNTTMNHGMFFDHDQQSHSSSIKEKLESLLGKLDPSSFHDITEKRHLQSQSLSSNCEPLTQNTFNLEKFGASLVPFAVADERQCAADLPFGLKSSWDEESPFFCLDCYTGYHNSWLQATSTDDDEMNFLIVWQFSNYRTLAGRFDRATSFSEPVTWTVIPYSGQVETMSGIWWWSNESGGWPEVASGEGFSKKSGCFGAGRVVNGNSNIPPKWGHCARNVGDRDDFSSGCGSLYENGVLKNYGNRGNIKTRMYVMQPSQMCLTWEQVGKDILGKDKGDKFGASVSLSLDGSHVAIGAPTYDEGRMIDSGKIQVFEDKNGDWIQKGENIVGESGRDCKGKSVSLSYDGNRVAVGAIFNAEDGKQSGNVYVYEYDERDREWKQLGNKIVGEEAGDQFGYSISLSANGGRIAIGAKYNDAYDTSSGQVRIFELNYQSKQWDQLGDGINGKGANENFGKSVSLSGDGKVVAVGFKRSRQNTDSGGARLYEYDDREGNWNQLGEDILVSEYRDGSDISVSLAFEGRRIAIGANQARINGSSRGTVQVYYYDAGNDDHGDDDNKWVQLGNDFIGEGEYDQAGSSVSLSADGKCVALGARFNDGNGKNSGHVCVFCYSGTSWTMVGRDIDGEHAGNEFGFSVSLSHDGSRVAVGAVEAFNDSRDDRRRPVNSGQGRVFDLMEMSKVQ